MKGIYYKEGIYVLIDSDIEHDDCVYHYNYRESIILYGGRINLDYIYKQEDYAHLLIDGVEIMKIDDAYLIDKDKNLSLHLSTISQYLNSIEANGVDSFLLNYRQSLEFLYDELKNLRQNTQSHLYSLKDESISETILEELEKIKKLFISVLCALFSLRTLMNAGLENQKVNSIYQSIIDTIS